jgi:hypothetical protein
MAPVEGDSSFTLAPGTTAPVGSVTSPPNEVVAWGHASAEANKIKQATEPRTTHFDCISGGERTFFDMNSLLEFKMLLSA